MHQAVIADSTASPFSSGGKSEAIPLFLAATPSRRAMFAGMAGIAAAAAVPATAAASSRSEWDRRVLAYRAAELLRRADEKFGALANAMEAWLVAKHESGDEKPSDGAFERIRTAEERHYRAYCDQVEEAAIALAMTPAPNLDAVEIKLAVIEREDLAGSERPLPLMDMIAADVRRLVSEAR